MMTKTKTTFTGKQAKQQVHTRNKKGVEALHRLFSHFFFSCVNQFEGKFFVEN